MDDEVRQLEQKEDYWPDAVSMAPDAYHPTPLHPCMTRPSLRQGGRPTLQDGLAAPSDDPPRETADGRVQVRSHPSV